MEPTRILAALLALNRIAFGATYLARPGAAGPSWIGRAARKPGAQVMIRSQAARDVGLGTGALWALAHGRGREARRWLLAHAFADGVDAVVTWSSRDRLPRRRARNAIAIAAGSTLVAAAGAARPGGSDA